MHILSRLYAFTYSTRHRRFLGVTIAAWLVLLLLTLALWAFFARWAPWISNAALFLAVAIMVGYWLAGRRGYTRFITDDGIILDPEFAAPRDESRGLAGRR